MKTVTADDNRASFLIRFSPAEPQTAALNNNPTRPELLLRATLRAPRVQQRATYRGIVCSAVFESRGDKIEGSYIRVFNERELSRGQEKQEAEKAAAEVGGKVKHVYPTALKGFAIEKGAPGSSGKIKADAGDAPRRFLGHGAKGRSGLRRHRTGGHHLVFVAMSDLGIVGGGAAGSFVTAWVIDTGIAPHGGLNFDGGRSRSFIRDKSPIDQNGHGTHVAGTIAALANCNGVIGGAPGAPAVAVRVLDRRGSGQQLGRDRRGGLCRGQWPGRGRRQHEPGRRHFDRARRRGGQGCLGWYSLRPRRGQRKPECQQQLAWPRQWRQRLHRLGPVNRVALSFAQVPARVRP